MEKKHGFGKLNVQELSSLDLINTNGGGPIARFIEWYFCDACGHHAARARMVSNVMARRGI